MEIMDQFELDKMRWAPRSTPSKGPLRLCRFCFLGVFLPITLLCVPLYMRFVSLRPHLFTLSPSDMKLLNHEHTVSTIWCQAQTLRMNSSFNAYLLPEKPRLLRQKQKVQMERKIIDLEDDMKEYWGFFLLADSSFRLSTCSRHEGSSVVVIKHTKNVARCAWLGELDSAEESDEISSEFDFQQEVLKEEEDESVENMMENNAGPSGEDDTDKVLLSLNSKEVYKYLENIEKWSVRSRKIIVKKLLNDPILMEEIIRNKPDEDLQKFLAKNSEELAPKIAEVKSKLVENIEDNVFENVGGEEYEDLDNNGDIYNFMNNGKFNQKNQFDNKEDKSNEETRSSWSSSEEALASCDGAVFNIPLNGATACHENATFDEMRSVMNNISYTTDTSGFYYFIFTNENEITSNFVAANFEMHKTVFDVRNYEDTCVNSTDCALNLSFSSKQHVVIETGATRFPETNLDLYSPRHLSTVDVIDIVSEHSYRSIATDSDNGSSSSQLEVIVEDTSVTDDEEIFETPACVEDDKVPESIKELTIEEDTEDEHIETVVDESDDDETCTSFFKTKEEDKLKLEGSGLKTDKLGPKTHYKPQRNTKDKSVLSLMTCSKALGAMGLISVRGLDHPLTGNAFLSEKTTNLIHDLEMRRDSFLRLQEEGKRGKAGFVTFEDIQNMEQVQKWTTSKVRDDLCLVHEAYQYFRHKYKAKDLKYNIQLASANKTPVRNEKEADDNENAMTEKVLLGVQHRGKITSKEATKMLRKFWPKIIIKEVEVKRRREVGDIIPGYTALWVRLRFAPGYNFENYLDWPEFEDNWPDTFDKGLFKEDDDDEFNS